MKTIDILQHEIEYFLKDENGVIIEGTPLHEANTNYIEEMIKDGFSSGELCCSQWIDEESDEPTELICLWNIKK